MDIILEELTHENFPAVCGIDRSDVGEDIVDGMGTIMELTDYGVAHGCLGHTFAVKYMGEYVGVILLGEAIEWECDPPEMKGVPFYRLMGFVMDRRYRGMGLGGAVLEMAIERVYREFGVRPIAMGCQEGNVAAARFYERHGFCRTEYRDEDDVYYLRYPAGE